MLPNLPIALRGHAAVLFGNQMVVVGGMDAKGDYRFDIYAILLGPDKVFVVTSLLDNLRKKR